MVQVSKSFNWPTRGKPSSTVVKCTDGLPPSEWEILLPHESIRFLQDELREVLKSFNPLKPKLAWQQECLGEWLVSTFQPIIHHHHEVEEKYYGPELEKRGVTLPEKVGKDHSYLIPALTKITEKAKKGFEDDQDLEKWKQDFLTVMDEFDEHMAYEEREYVAVVKQANMSEEAHAEAIQAMVAQIPGWVQALEFPSIIYNMHRWYGTTDKISTRLHEMGVPFFIIILLNTTWIPNFFTNTINRLEHLKTEEVPFQIKGCC